MKRKLIILFIISLCIVVNAQLINVPQASPADTSHAYSTDVPQSYSTDTQQAYSAEITPDEAVSIMQEYGFLRGTDKGLELDRVPTRLEAVIMAVRVLNCETWALTEDWDNSKFYEPHSFIDVPSWADSYVSCAINYKVYYTNYRLLYGISETELGSDMPISAEQCVTLLLRALDYYDVYGNFDMNNPWELSDHIGLTDGSYPRAEGFTRRDMVYLAYKTLRANRRDDGNMYYFSFVYKRLPGTEFPEIFQSNNANILVHWMDRSKMIEVGETSEIHVGYGGDNVGTMNVEVMDPMIVRVVEEKKYDSGGMALTYAGLKLGKTSIKITYAEDYGEPYAIGFINFDVVGSKPEPTTIIP